MSRNHFYSNAKISGVSVHMHDLWNYSKGMWPKFVSQPY